MPSLIHITIQKIAAFLFPERCLGCKKSGEVFCLPCRREARGRQKEKTSIPFLDKLYHYGSYSNKALKASLRHLKYHGAFTLASPLARMLHEAIKPRLAFFPERETVIVPVPTSPDRMRQRGYNQAELLARELAAATALPFSSDILLKTRPTPSQVELKDQARLVNVRDSFGLKPFANLAGKRVILVDDISTTGATLSESARVLKKAGAREVIGLVVAKG